MHAGMLSGYLLQEYCPDAHACDARTGEEMGELGRCDGRRMWGIIGTLTLTSPLLILTLQVRPIFLACLRWQHVARSFPEHFPKFLIYILFAPQLNLQVRKPRALMCVLPDVAEVGEAKAADGSPSAISRGQRRTWDSRGQQYSGGRCRRGTQRSPPA